MEEKAPKNCLAVSVSNVSKKFASGAEALRGVSLDVAAGEFVVLGGANGSGKTVLMTLLAALDFPTEGEIATEGTVGLVFQEADSQILGETVIEDAMFAPLNCGLSKSAARQIAEDALVKCGLGQKLDFAARLLSGGQKRRLAVAGVLALKADIIVFDEPFANLDLEGVRQVISILRSLKAEGKTVLVLTHEIEKCLALADRFVVLHQGCLRFDGKPEAALEQNLEAWGIRNPLVQYKSVADLVW